MRHAELVGLWAAAAAPPGFTFSGAFCQNELIHEK